MLLLLLTELDLEACEVVAEGSVVALLPGAETAEELESGSAVTVANVVLASGVLTSVGAASAVLVVISATGLSVLASAVVVMAAAVLSALATLAVEEASAEATAEEAVPVESMGN